MNISVADYGRRGQKALRHGHVGVNLLYNTKQVLSAPPGDGAGRGVVGEDSQSG